MQHMGITKESVKDHTVYLIDCIGSGGGLAYLTRCIAEIAYNGELTEEATSHINIIALNEVDQKYIKFSCELKRHDLKMHALTKTLDRVSDDNELLRLMPSANSYKWSEEFIKEVENHSMHIFDHVNPFFTEVIGKINEFIASE